MDLTYFIGPSGVKQNPLCGCGFAGIYVGNNSYIANMIKFYLA
jgi:hypothetical protein